MLIILSHFANGESYSTIKRNQIILKIKISQKYIRI